MGSNIPKLDSYPFYEAGKRGLSSKGIEAYKKSGIAQTYLKLDIHLKKMEDLKKLNASREVNPFQKLKPVSKILGKTLGLASLLLPSSIDQNNSAEFMSKKERKNLIKNNY